MGRLSRSSILTMLLAGALLAACGGQPAAPEAANAPSPAAPTPAPVAPATAAAAPTTPPPTLAPVAPATAAAAPTTPPPTAGPATAAPVAADGPFAGIPQGRTPEGYPVLGDPGAGVTIVMYSDFL